MVFLEKSQGSVPWVIAHRGYSGKFPENTLAAFEAAIEAGADMIELDVLLTQDRRVVVCHDLELDRTTNGTGRIDELSLSELRKLDAGSWFDPQFKTERVPLLEEVLDLCKGKILINIEIKSEAYEKNPSGTAIETQLYRLIQEWKLENSVLISSFQHDFLTRLQRLDSRLKTALLHDPEHDDADLLKVCAPFRIFSCNPAVQSVTPELVKKLHQKNIRVLPYTVNEPEAMRRLIEWEVDGLFTDEPLRLKQLVTQRLYIP